MRVSVRLLNENILNRNNQQQRLKSVQTKTHVQIDYH